MEDKRWRRRQGSRSSQYRKPPLGNLQPTVPKWERNFCETVGGLSWKTLLQMKQYLVIDQGVLKWDDCAGKEAFDTAKTRYWTETNGFSCDVLPSNPNLYIDKIDWDAQPEDKVLEDLERLSVVADTEGDHEPVIKFSEEFMQSHSMMQSSWNNVSLALDGQHLTIVPTGWGDEDVNLQAPVNQYPAILSTVCGNEDENLQVPYNREPIISPSGCGDKVENKVENGQDTFNQYLEIMPTVWGDNDENHQVPFNQYPAIASTGLGEAENVEVWFNECVSIPPTGCGEDRESHQVPLNKYPAIVPTGWVDDVENRQVAFNQYPDIVPTGWGDDAEDHQVRLNQYPDIQPTGWGDEDENLQVPINQQAANFAHMWPSYGNGNWQNGEGIQSVGYTSGSDKSGSDSGLSNRCYNKHSNTEPYIKAKNVEQGPRDNSNYKIVNAGHRAPKGQGRGRHQDHWNDEDCCWKTPLGSKQWRPHLDNRAVARKQNLGTWRPKSVGQQAAEGQA